MTASTIWEQVLGRIEAKVGRHSFHTWFKPTTLLLDDGSRVAVQVPNPLFTEWLPKHYSVVLAEALKDVGRPNAELIFVPEVKQAVPVVQSPTPLPELLVEDASPALGPSVGLN